jgi:hypothetical protein
MCGAVGGGPELESAACLTNWNGPLTEATSSTPSTWTSGSLAKRPGAGHVGLREVVVQPSEGARVHQVSIRTDQIGEVVIALIRTGRSCMRSRWSRPERG